MTNEWNIVYGIIENVNMLLPSILKKFGKPLNDRLPQIRARIRSDSESVLKAHPDVKEIAKSIDDTFVRLAEQVVQPTKAPTTVPAPAVTTQELPPKAKCGCGYHFLVADSQADCRDHLDRYDKFAELTAKGKTRLCGQLGLTAYKQSKQLKAKAELIACRHCGRDFTKAQSQWLYDVHLKQKCKKGAPSLDDLPGSSTPGPKTPVTTPSGRILVNEHGWQNTGAAKKAETSVFVPGGLGFRSKGIEQKERGGDYTNQCDTTKLGVVIDGEV
ncbi:hypothetical protein J4E91_003160 [Alternaria rosae]|nr:hypothetical protein J4E91_003160 [Alternaria rosae]